jgi:hypothetical protein
MANTNGWGDGAANNTIGWGQGANNAIGWGDIHADSWAGATDIVGVQAASLLLDTYTGAAVAYSLRKLRTNYSGNAIRVRRSSDNTEQDFGFNDFNNTLIDWVGYNLWTFSEEWNQGVWTKNGLNTTGTPSYIDVETAPDGTLTADKITETLISQGHFTSRLLSVTTGVTYNVSVYLKHGGRNARVESSLSNLATYTVDVDLLTGTLSNNTFPITPILEDVGSGWYRLSYQVTATNTQTRTVITILLLNQSGSPSPVNYLGDGVSGVFIWGAQATATSLVRKYTKTVATANNGDAFIATWYDQSTNANNATQATAASQAQIVLSGALILDADTSKITSTWTSDRYTLTNGISTNTQYFSISMWRRGATTTDTMIHLGNLIGNDPCSLWWVGTANSFSVRSYMSTLLSYENVPTVGRCIMTSLRNSANLKVAYRNGVQLTNTATQAPVSGTLTTFGQLSTNAFTSGQYQEYIYWDSEQSANRIAIETDINTYWNAY